MNATSMPGVPKVKAIKVHPSRRQCMSCPNHQLERGFLHWKVSCTLPDRRVEYTASGKEKLLACPLVDPMSRELDKFYENYYGHYPIENSLPHRTTVLHANSSTTPQSVVDGGCGQVMPHNATNIVAFNAAAERRAAHCVATEAEAKKSSYTELVAMAATIMELTEWKEDLDNNMLAKVFDCICVYGFAATLWVLASLLGFFLPIPAVIITYAKFISIAAQLVAVYAGGSKFLRAHRQSSKLETERDRLEMELAIALTKSKYNRAQIDKAATRKRTSA